MAEGIWNDLMIEFDGKIVEGSYCVSDWMITVRMKDGGTKSARLTDLKTETLAKSLLRKLAQQQGNDDA